MAERASPFAAEVSGEANGLTLSAVQRGSLWQVAAWPETFAEVEAALTKACKCDAPAPGKIVPGSNGRDVIRTEPLKWWIRGKDGAACPLKLKPAAGAWLDMSHDQAGLAIEGAQASELLKRMVSLDLRDAAFPDLTFASTQMHHMITKVLRKDAGDAPRYEVWVMRSYADDLREIAEHHLHHFG